MLETMLKVLDSKSLLLDLNNHEFSLMDISERRLCSVHLWH